MNQVDRLAAIRGEIRALLAEAKTIRARLLAGQGSLFGNDYVAEVRSHVVLRPIKHFSMADHEREREFYNAD